MINNNMMKTIFLVLLCSLLLSCGASRVPEQSQGHISEQTENTIEKKSNKKNIPKPLLDEPMLPEPQNISEEEVYTVVVHEVSIKELLFALARDAKINIDIGDQIENVVTLNAIDQTLSQILERLTDDNDLYYEIKGDVVKIRKDRPFIKIYPIDYLNISRNSFSQVSVATEIGSTGRGAVGDNSSSSSANSNSNTVVNNVSNNQFWATLEQNIRLIIGESGSDENSQNNATTGTGQGASGETSSEDSQGTASNVIVNRETGIIAVNTTHKIHHKIQDFLDHVMVNSKRQVMIEATIAEIQLSNDYQAGVDWTSLRLTGAGFSFNQGLIGENLNSPPAFTGTWRNNDIDNPLNVTLKALEKFGDVKVLSSPKLMVLNNQTALLKVVDNIVYFTIDVDIEPATDNSPRLITYTSIVHTVPVGFVMALTAYINDSDNITLNVRPTISRQIGSVVDPNPALADSDVENIIPLIQVREMESILKINDGDTAVLGGLMQNENKQGSSGIPLISGVPMIGDFFSMKDNTFKKSELVIFIKASVIKSASLEKDLKNWKKYLPSDDNPDQSLPPVSNPWGKYLKKGEQTDVLGTQTQGVE
jgi:general secretion pathway protein D